MQENNEQKEKKINNSQRRSSSALTLRIVLCGVFSALCFAILYLPKIPIPSAVGKPFIHLGNLVVILIALLFGGVEAGVSGSIGMTMYDILNGYVSSAPKTFILKFLMGIVTGSIYAHYKKHQKKHMGLAFIILSIFFLLLGTMFLVLAIVYHGQVVVGTKTIDITWPMYVASFLLSAFFYIMLFITRMQAYDYKIAMFAATIGTICNMIGEFIGKFIQCMIRGEGVMPSIAQSASSLAGSILTGVVTLTILAIVYQPLKKAVSEIKIM